MYNTWIRPGTAASSRAHQPGSGPLTGQAFSLFSQACMGGNGAMWRGESRGERGWAEEREKGKVWGMVGDWLGRKESRGSLRVMVGRREGGQWWDSDGLLVGGRGKNRRAITTVIVVFREGPACFTPREEGRFYSFWCFCMCVWERERALTQL